jgi:hypothetical protein
MREAAGEALGALIGGSIQNKLIEQQDGIRYGLKTAC